ncbi:hypothetical protein ACLB2K_007497 [Fragaria x ananassa]
MSVSLDPVTWEEQQTLHASEAACDVIIRKVENLCPILALALTALWALGDAPLSTTLLGFSSSSRPCYLSRLPFEVLSIVKLLLLTFQSSFFRS